MANAINQLDRITQVKIREEVPILKTGVDRLLEWAPSFSLLVTAVLKKRRPLQIAYETAVFLGALALQKGAVLGLKRLTHHVRPNGSLKRNSFPSGHTATGFMGAELLRQELNEAPVVLQTTGYLMAIGTGILRLCKNKHWLSDVLCGALVGFTSVRIAYRAIDLLTKKKTNPTH